MRLLATLPVNRDSSSVKHYTGLPPEMTEGKDLRQELSGASFLVIEESGEGTFLFRYGLGGAFVGDTWHMNVDDAKHQASYEYGDAVETWVDVPPHVKDVAAYGVDRLSRA